MILKTITFDPRQAEAVEAMVATLSRQRPSPFTLGGFAGSGKTTILKSVLERLVGRTVAVAAFTGKATSVLRKKGIGHAQTLHSLIYHYDQETKEFYRRGRLEVGGFAADAVIMDEASMLNRSLHGDLLSFGLPVVFVGDHGQLEPIGDNPGVMLRPDLTLETIHRQADDSGILDVAHAFREGRVPKWNQDAQMVSYDEAMERLDDVDVVLCGLNATRSAVNDFIRKRRGVAGPFVEGETVVVLRNNPSFGVFNGMLLSVRRIRYELHGAYTMDLVDPDEGRVYEAVPCRLFQDVKSDDLREVREVVALDYGYCLSVHKFQGSEADRVLVIEERGPWDGRRWRYTAATRASKKLLWTY